MYALPVIGNIWGFNGYAVQEPQKVSFVKSDNQRLQTIQRNAESLLMDPVLGLDIRPTADILIEVGWISVHQLTAYSILNLFMKMIATGVPHNIVKNLERTRDTRTAQGNFKTERYNLNLTKETFVNKAIRLYNELPSNSKKLYWGPALKNELKKWVKTNVTTKV